MKPISNLHLCDIMEQNVHSVDVDCLVSELIQLLQKHPVSLVVVLEKNIPVGMFTERDLIRLLHNNSQEDKKASEIMSKPVSTVPAALGFRSAYIQLCLNRLRHVVAIDEEGKVVGIAAERNFLGHMGLELFQSVSSIISVIDKEVPQLQPSTRVTDAIHEMIHVKRGCVVTPSNNKGYCVFTEHMAPGILAQHSSDHDSSKLVSLEEVAVFSEPVTVNSHISDVIAQLVEEGIGYVIVVNSYGDCIGTISQSSLLESVRAAVYGEMATRQLVEDELLRLETQLEATLEQTPNVAVQWFDLEGQIQYWNHASEAIYGWTSTEAIGQKIEVLVKNKKEVDEFKSILQEIKNSGKTIGPREFSKHDKHGNTHWIESTIFPIPGEDTDGDYFVCMDVDVSKRREIENQLIKYQTDLEQLVKKRTQELYLEKKHAEEISKSKSAFLAVMSHEIRTPMNAIIGMTDLALNTALTEKQDNYIKKANLSAKNLLGILNDILDYSKIEAGKLTLEVKNFLLTDIITDTVNLLKLKAEERSIDIKIKIAPDVPKALIGDSLRLGQILINLCNNAIKFSHSGHSVLIAVNLKQDNRKDAVIHFSIHDTGIGMTTEQQQRIFQSFTQADDSTSRQFGGSGLGLSISRQLCELMGGNIWCESKINQGSTFHFTTVLMKQDKQLSNDSTINSLESENSISIECLRDCNILLVEDNEINQELAIELLMMNHMNVKTANNGQEALNQLEKYKFDGILMDCQMPVMDGYEATRRIRLQNCYKDIPIIALTANAMKGDKDAIIESGMNDLIIKPIYPDTMFATMAKWIKKV